MTNKNNANNMFLKMYPVGSVYISNTNTNPGTIFGGTWTLIDKEFSNYASYAKPNTNPTLTNTGWFTPNNDVIDNSETEMDVIRAGHNIRIRLVIKTKVQLSETNTTIGYLNYNEFGINALDMSLIYHPVCDDTINGCLFLRIDGSTGELLSVDAITSDSTNVIAANKQIYFEFSLPLTYGKMLDSACNKFYFKRTA